MKSIKGAVFERHVCTQLSLWWSDGEREDIFWRAQGSGGRATRRTKAGKSTFGSYGDVAAVDPIGNALTLAITIELKRGYTKQTVADLLDRPAHTAVAGMEAFLIQAMTAAHHAKSFSWVLIAQRNQRQAFIYYPKRLNDALLEVFAFQTTEKDNNLYPSAVLCCQLRFPGNKVKQRVIYAMPLATFLQQVKRFHVEALVKRHAPCATPG